MRKKQPTREEFVFTDFPQNYDTKQLKKTSSVEDLIPIITEYKDYLKTNKKTFLRFKKAYDAIVKDELSLYDKLFNKEEELTEIKNSLKESQSLNAELTEELNYLKQSPGTIDDVLRDIHDVVCRIMEDPQASSEEISEEYQEIMGNAEEVMKHIANTSSEFERKLEISNKTIEQYKKEFASMKKVIDSKTDDTELLEKTLSEKATNIFQLESAIVELEKENEDYKYQINNMEKNIDVKTMNLQVDYDAKEAQFLRMKEDLFNANVDIENKKSEQENIQVTLNTKNQEIAERKKLFSKMKAEMKEIRKNYKATLEIRDNEIKEKNELIAKQEKRVIEDRDNFIQVKANEMSVDRTNEQSEREIVVSPMNNNSMKNEDGQQDLIEDLNNLKLEYQIRLEEMRSTIQDQEQTIKDRNSSIALYEEEQNKMLVKIKDLQVKRENAINEIKMLKSNTNTGQKDFKGEVLNFSSKNIRNSMVQSKQETPYKDQHNSETKRKIDSLKLNEKPVNYIFVINPEKQKHFTEALGKELKTIYTNFINYATQNPVGEIVELERILNISQQRVTDFNNYVDDKITYLNLD